MANASAPGASPFPTDHPPALRRLGVVKRSTRRSRRRPREVAEPATMIFVFSGWGDGRESRARAAPTDRPRMGEPFGPAVGPGAGSA